ncbi:UNKNOWN [Stylonychia lemnae]|uniref:Uncharacterized protein n=1 Tax=Stylonychia lemnae TaxID=5949 RepID=A0A078ADS0_STYLE|nr:UNKNOWN [Stylonychia lemnae]|eukprot:CDW79986.1 UNKNOWN [Stylonychia lemnae]
MSNQVNLQLSNLTNDLNNYPMIFISGSHNLSHSQINNMRTNLDKKINYIISATSTTLQVTRLVSQTFQMTLLNLESSKLFLNDSTIKDSENSLLNAIGVQSQNTVIEIHNTIFSNLINSDIKDSTFDGNQAVTVAGSINYYCSPDSDKQSNIFKSNYAKYGENYASYGYELKIISKQQNLDLQNLVSGQNFPSDLLVGIYDQNGQLITIDNDSEATLFSEDISLQISGKCITGEVLQNNKCILCLKGTFSLDASKTQCQRCLDSTTCNGGSEINLDQGVWRSSTNSTRLYKCSNIDACPQNDHIYSLFVEEGLNQNAAQAIKESCALNVLEQQMGQYMQGQVLQFALNANQFISKFSLQLFNFKYSKEKQASNCAIENFNKLLLDYYACKRL